MHLVDLERRLNTVILWFILPTSGAAALINVLVLSEAPTRYTVGAVGSVLVAALTWREIAGQRRAAVPAAAGVIVIVAAWLVTPDDATRRWIDTQLLFGPLLVGILVPRWWRFTAPATALGLFALGVVEVALGRASAADSFARFGVLAIVTTGLIVVIALIDESRRTALADRSALVDASGAALMHLSYTNVQKRFADLRNHGVDDLDAYLDEHPEELGLLIGRIIVQSYNDAALRLYGLDPEDDLAAQVNLPTEVHSVIRREMSAVWNGEISLEHDYSLRRRDGDTIWVRQTWTASVVEGRPDYSVVVLATLDVTDVKRAEEALETEIRAKDEFIASVSHELRTPLAAVVGLAAELRDRGEGFEALEVRELVKLIADQSIEVSDIVEDLLVAARIEYTDLNVAPEHFDVVDLIRSIYIGVPVDGPAEAAVWADPSRVRQILRNLYVNAERHGGEERRVVVDIHDGEVAIEVRDNGPGVPEGFRDEMFEPYHSLGSTPGITASVGLGLTVSRRLAELMGGDLEYLRDQDETVFRVTLLHRPPGQAA